MIHSLDIQYDYKVSVIDPISSENLFISRRNEEKKNENTEAKQHSNQIADLLQKANAMNRAICVCAMCLNINFNFKANNAHF